MLTAAGSSPLSRIRQIVRRETFSRCAKSITDNKVIGFTFAPGQLLNLFQRRRCASYKQSVTGTFPRVMYPRQP